MNEGRQRRERLSNCALLSPVSRRVLGPKTCAYLQVTQMTVAEENHYIYRLGFKFSLPKLKQVTLSKEYIATKISYKNISELTVNFTMTAGAVRFLHSPLVQSTS